MNVNEITFFRDKLTANDVEFGAKLEQLVSTALWTWKYDGRAIKATSDYLKYW